MVKFSWSRNFPDLEIYDHKTRLKISHEIPWPCTSAMGIESSIRGYHVYRNIWTQVIDKVLVCERDLERHNIHDPFAVVEESPMGPWGPANEPLGK